MFLLVSGAFSGYSHQLNGSKDSLEVGKHTPNATFPPRNTASLSHHRPPSKVSSRPYFLEKEGCWVLGRCSWIPMKSWFGSEHDSHLGRNQGLNPGSFDADRGLLVDDFPSVRTARKPQESPCPQRTGTGGPSYSPTQLEALELRSSPHSPSLQGTPQLDAGMRQLRQGITLLELKGPFMETANVA